VGPSSTTVNVNINGKKAGSLQVASQGDAETLAGVLKAVGEAGRSAGTLA
jgi:hypothetical protein